MSSTSKPAPTHPWNDQSIELIVGRLLRTGVLLSAAVVTFGGILYLSRHGHMIVDYRTFRGNLSPFRTLSGIFHGMLQFSASAIIQFGLLLLIATPIARVIFSAIAFTFERDYLYVAFTLTVLAILLYSLLGS